MQPDNAQGQSGQTGRDLLTGPLSKHCFHSIRCCLLFYRPVHTQLLRSLLYFSALSNPAPSEPVSYAHTELNIAGNIFFGFEEIVEICTRQHVEGSILFWCK